MSNKFLRPIVGMTLASLIISHTSSALAQIVVAVPPIKLATEASPVTLASSQQPAASEPLLGAGEGEQESGYAAPNQSPIGEGTASISYLPEQLPIGRISIDLRPKAERGNTARPKDESLAAVGHIPTVHAAPATYWPSDMSLAARPTAADVPYQPLYFEEVNLERYGRSCGICQPAVSAARFFGTVPLLPYAMTNRPPGEINYWRWPYPAGWCAPKVRELPPLDARAAAVESSVVTGMFFLLP